jgi:hypothetical protein
VAEDQRFAHFVDERGTLTAVELGDVPFPVRRIFVVHGTEARLPRGDHEVPCEELVVLLSGSACFVTTTDGRQQDTALRHRGQQLRLRPGVHVSYVLDGPESSILVLASDGYRSPVS